MKFRLVNWILLSSLILFPVSALASTWARTYGYSYYDYANSVQQTSDGGFIIAGENFHSGSASSVYWIVKLNADGNITWQKTYGNSGSNINQTPNSIRETSDGGFIVAGITNAYGAGNNDYWILKLDANGNIIWQKSYGGSYAEYAYSIQETSDNGFIVAGHTVSFGIGYSTDCWILKLDANGDILWQKTYGGNGSDYARSIQQTSDGGYIVAGYTNSNHAGSNYDLWILKLDSNGDVNWQKAYAGYSFNKDDFAYEIQETSDGELIVAGITKSFGADFDDFWVLKLDATGSVIWQKRYGGNNSDKAYSIQVTSDGGYIVAGNTRSYGAGNNDIWIIKLDANGNINWQKTYGGSGYDYANSIEETSSGGFIVAGESGTFGNWFDFWILKLDGNGDIPGCSIIQNSTASPIDTNTVIDGTDVIPRDSNATVTITAVEPIDTDALIAEQCFSECQTDLDGDGDVDDSDLSQLIVDFGRNDCSTELPCAGDFVNDGDVDGSDLGKFADEFGREDCPYLD